MTQPSHSSSGPVCSPSITGFGPRTGAVLGACALVFTAHALGARWLGELALGLPAGVWIIAAAWATAHVLLQSRSAPAPARSLASDQPGDVADAQTSIDLVRTDPPALAPMSAEPDGLLKSSGDLARRTARALRRRTAGRAGELHVGLDLPAPEAAQIMLALDDSPVGNLRAVFEQAEHGPVKTGPDDCAAFDALLRKGADGQLYLFVHQRDGAPAAWADWSEPAPLSYLSVFPVRLDTARVRLGEVDLSRNDLARLTARLAVAAAALGRTPARLGKPGVNPYRRSASVTPGAANACVTNVGDALLSVMPEGAERAGGLCRSAARLLSAFVTGVDRTLPDTDRLHLATAAGAFLDRESESLLRVGALRLACGQVEAGLGALTDAAEQLKRGGASCTLDPAPMVLAEAELAAQTADDRLAFGRLCAGVALMCATSRQPSLDYLRDDLVDDLTCCGWAKMHSRDMTVLEMLLNQLGAATSRAPTRAMGQPAGPARRAA
jgi:hypothetical protein